MLNSGARLGQPHYDGDDQRDSDAQRSVSDALDKLCSLDASPRPAGIPEFSLIPVRGGPDFKLISQVLEQRVQQSHAAAQIAAKETGKE